MTEAAPPDQVQPGGITPSQTVGPFFAYCLTPATYHLREIFSNDLTRDGVAGQRIRIEGRIYDGEGALVTDAMVEIWQADCEGRYPQGDGRVNVGFRGFGRAECGSDGRFAITTIKPGRVPGPNGTMQAPHINVGIFARGILRRLFTRIYFSDEAGNSEDPILALVPAERRSTLVATRGDGGAEPLYTFDIHLQGEDETVFFEA